MPVGRTLLVKYSFSLVTVLSTVMLYIFHKYLDHIFHAVCHIFQYCLHSPGDITMTRADTAERTNILQEKNPRRNITPSVAKIECVYWYNFNLTCVYSIVSIF